MSYGLNAVLKHISHSNVSHSHVSHPNDAVLDLSDLQPPAYDGALSTR